MRIRLTILIAIGVFAALCGTLQADDGSVSAEQAEFFEKQIRPVLAEHCDSCHGARKQEGGLRLDSRASLLKGSDSGPVVVAGTPTESLLIEAVRQTGDLKMPPPPKDKLAPEAIAALVRWVELGLPWPATDGKSATAAKNARSHWAFQPIARPAVPAVNDAGWSKTDIDRFVLAKLESPGLSPAPPADRRALLRRASFDLTGLPPAPADVAAFENDPSPTAKAFAAVVDRLLASPHYGERWARHWLDVARYADNKGYVFFEEPSYPWAYAYRDWVIRALNDDLPYDQFILQQLAADQLPLGPDKRPLAALGFLTIGGHFMNNVHDIFDDRIDVVSRGLLGLTVTCARCHDHKYDPIPQADYYSLYGVFRSASEPTVPPAFDKVPETEGYEYYELELFARRSRLDRFLERKHNELVAGGRTRVAEYLLAAHASRDQPSTEDFMLLIPEGDLHPLVVQRYWLHLQRTRKTHDPVWAPWHALAAIPGDEFADKSAKLLNEFLVQNDPARQQPVNPLVIEALAAKSLQSMPDVAARYGELLAGIDKQWHEIEQSARDAKGPPPTGLANPHAEQLRQVYYAPDAPANVPRVAGWGVLTLLPDRAAQAEFQKLVKDLESWMIHGPHAPPRAMVLVDDPVPYDPRVFLRGNPNRAGNSVTRKFLAFLSAQSEPFPHGSGRLDLARAIVDRKNPLTARVIVNRVWQHHFGAGLVRTPSDFGVRSDPPSHPELLDHLASTFMDDGWSIKKLHRRIMLSSVYQQSSSHPSSPLSNSAPLPLSNSSSSPLNKGGPGGVAPRANQQSISSPLSPLSPRGRGVGGEGAATLDPENRLLWKMPPRRLEFESLRDSLLFVAGVLDPAIGGPSANLLAGSNRRSVYGFIDRLALPGLFRTFDFPSPDATSAQRDQTTVAPQALYLLNGPLALDCSGKVLARPEIASEKDFTRRVDLLHRLLFSRAAPPDDLKLADQFFGSDAGSRESSYSWQRYVHALLLTNEFAFVD
jgi:mono/diheme cytochrome c family protein